MRGRDTRRPLQTKVVVCWILKENKSIEKDQECERTPLVGQNLIQ